MAVNKLLEADWHPKAVKQLNPESKKDPLK
jgi:hypothetical protein